MSFKRILGTMLASRMAGRGRRRGGLGTAAMLGGFGGRRRGMGSKAGLAALGYMAYRAYQDHQSRNAGSAGTTRSGVGTGSASGVGGMVKDLVDRFSGSGSSSNGGAGGTQSNAAPEYQEGERAAEEFSDDKALLLVRAMITAAYSDGTLSADERGRIMQHLDEAGADSEDRRTMAQEIDNPKSLDELIGQVHDQDTAQEFYFASRAAIDAETEANRAYLSNLRQRLGLSEQDAAEVEELAS